MYKSVAISLFASMALAAPGLSNSVQNRSADLPDTYCTFYSDDACTKQVGSVNYNVYNSGCFQNSGGWIKCSGFDKSTFQLVQSPSNDDTCNCQTNCGNFGVAGADPYSACTPINLTKGYTDFRIDTTNSCGPNNC